MTRRLITRTPLENSVYPNMQVRWDEYEDGLGWKGTVTFWTDGNSRESAIHEIELRQSTPLGGIYASVDAVSHGCWASTKFEGTVLTERDLQWAAAWAAVEIRRKREALG